MVDEVFDCGVVIVQRRDWTEMERILMLLGLEMKEGGSRTKKMREGRCFVDDEGGSRGVKTEISEKESQLWQQQA